jgi:hypothetical protein
VSKDPGPLDSPYTIRSIQEMLGLSRGVIAGMIAAGFVAPGRGPAQRIPLHLPGRGAAAHRRELQAARIAPRRILQALRRLRRSCRPSCRSPGCASARSATT